MEAVSQGSDGDDKVAELKEELKARGELNEDLQQGVAAPAAEQRKSAFALDVTWRPLHLQPRALVP
eukprot:4506387-Prymnesium_polylepis.1